MPIRIFAITSRGLEQVAAGEMESLPGIKVNEVSYRRITATYAGDLSRLIELRTVDDVFIDLATWDDIGPQRSSLEMLKERSKHLNIYPGVKIISKFRSISTSPSFSVTANFVGRRNYTVDEIKRAIAGGITQKYQWQYTTEDVSEVNIRIFIEHNRAYLGIRLSDIALHRRLYKQSHVPGSLKPSVAAAMLQIAGITPGQRVLDPFCGAGTILVEAALLGIQAYGGDNQTDALLAAKSNAALAGVQVHLQSWDAQHLPFASHSVERVVSNLPWGRQVNVDENLASFYRNVCYEFTRVLKRNGQVVLLTNLPQLVQLDGLKKIMENEISLFGMNPSIMKFSS